MLSILLTPVTSPMKGRSQLVTPVRSLKNRQWRSQKSADTTSKGNVDNGVSGKNYQFQHPKPFPNLLKNGTRANTGCTKGKKCTYFHPKMCPSSLTKGVCVDRTCEKKHVKGTRRAEDGTRDEQLQQRQEQQQQQKQKQRQQQQRQQQPIQQHASSQQSKSEVNSLELISFLKTELMRLWTKR